MRRLEMMTTIFGFLRPQMNLDPLAQRLYLKEVSFIDCPPPGKSGRRIPQPKSDQNAE
jgi:hypothetical protein